MTSHTLASAADPGHPDYLDAMLITTVGYLYSIRLPADSHRELAALYAVIGCDTVDVVRLTERLDMYLDDEGLINGQPINPIATILARHFGRTTQPYAGPAVLTSLGPDGRDRSLSLALRRHVRDLLGPFLSPDQPSPALLAPRAQALIDGRLVPVSRRLAALYGFEMPLALTRGVWDECIAATDDTQDTAHAGEHQDGRLRNLLDTVRTAVGRATSHNPSAGRLGLDLRRTDRSTRHRRTSLVSLVLTCGPGDDPQPVGTIHLPQEQPSTAAA